MYSSYAHLARPLGKSNYRVDFLVSITACTFKIEGLMFNKSIQPKQAFSENTKKTRKINMTRISQILFVKTFYLR